MFATGSIYTKSKFLGLSLAVHNIGKSKRNHLFIFLFINLFVCLFAYSVTLNLMDHGEEYECNIPNAYARSVSAGTNQIFKKLTAFILMYMYKHYYMYLSMFSLFSKSFFPLFLRSILTYPWMELGGKCTVKCEKTGYRSEIDFHCKVSIH